MKIIAHMDGQKYLAEVTSRELRELNSEISIQVGAEYEITKAAETLYALRSLNKSRLVYMKKQIDELQRVYEEIEESYNAVMLLDTIKNSEEDGV